MTWQQAVHRGAATLAFVLGLPAACSSNQASPALGASGAGDLGAGGAEAGGEPASSAGAASGGATSGAGAGTDAEAGDGNQAGSSAGSVATTFSSKSLAFDGVDGYVALGETAELLGNEPVSHSVAVWVRHAGEPRSGEGIIDFNVPGSFGQGTDVFWSLEDSTPSIAFYAPGGSRLAASVPEPTAWHHVVAVLDLEAADNQAKLYLDGALAQEGPLKSSDVVPEGAAEAGRYYGMNGFALQGLLDELGIWKTPLDAAEVDTLYNAGTPTDLSVNAGEYVSAAALVAYYRLGESDESPDALTDERGDHPAAAHGGVEFSSDVPGAP